MEISHHFKINPIEFTDTVYCADKKTMRKTTEYSKTKNVSGANRAHFDDNRSICQMIRNVNGMTNLTHHNKFIYAVVFANNAVIRLNQFKGIRDGKWGDDNRPRSVFTEEKRQLGISYLKNPHHSIWEVLSDIYVKMENETHKSYLEEISYYFQRINEKMLEYEQNLGIIEY